MKLVPLREVCIFNPPKSEARDAINPSDLVSFMPMQDLGIESKNAETSSCKPLNEVIKGYTYFAENDVLIAKITPCFENGKMGIARNLVNGIGFGSSEYFVLRSTDSVLSEYLYYFLRQEFVIENGRGIMTGAVGHRRVPGEYLENLEIPLPSLEKQREIVEKLDSAFAEIDSLAANLGMGDEKANQLLQSFLSSSFSLTADENDSINDSVDQSIARKLVPLGEVCTIINGGTPNTKISKFWNGKHAWITPAEMGNLKSPFLSGSKRTLTDEGLSNSSAQLVPKYSVIMSSRAPIGHLVINEIPMASNQGCKGLIPNKNLNYKYLYYFLYANKQNLNELGSGTTFAEISGSKLKTVLIPLPSLGKQNEVVEKLDRAFIDIELLKAQIRNQKDYAVALRQSILSSAFILEEAVA